MRGACFILSVVAPPSHAEPTKNIPSSVLFLKTSCQVGRGPQKALTISSAPCHYQNQFMQKTTQEREAMLSFCSDRSSVSRVSIPSPLFSLMCQAVISAQPAKILGKCSSPDRRGPQHVGFQNHKHVENQRCVLWQGVPQNKVLQYTETCSSICR